MEHQIQLIDVSAIEPDPEQPRAVDPDHVASLAISFEATGKEQALFANPIKVRQNGSPATFVIVNGHHRHGAYLLNDYEKIPAIVSDVDDDLENFEDQILDNFNRKQMEPMEIARSFQKSLDMHSSVAQIAEKVGKDENFVEEHLALNNLPDAMQRQLEAGDIFVTTAKKLGMLKDPKAIEKAWKRVRRFKKVGDQIKCLENLMTENTQTTAKPEPEATVGKKKAKTRFKRFRKSVSGYKEFFVDNSHVTVQAIMPDKARRLEMEDLEKNLRSLADTISEARKSYLEKTNTDSIE